MPLCEKFLKPLICYVLLQPGDATTHRNTRVLAYKLARQFTEHFDIVQILRMEDEPHVEEDLVAMLINDSETTDDNILFYHVFSLLDSGLLSLDAKFEFLKQKESTILQLLDQREMTVSVKKPNDKRLADKVAAAAAAKVQENLAAVNKTNMLRQAIIIQHIPSLLFGLLISGATSEHTLALQDMAQEVLVKLVDIAIDSKPQMPSSEFSQKKQETLSSN